MKNIHIGITGTKEGMTYEQYEVYKKYSNMIGKYTLHHGDCIGVDCEIQYYTSSNTGNHIVVHPPENKKYQCYRRTTDNMTILKSKDYLERNKDIVNDSDVMFACPKENEEQLRSGTWATIRYSRKMKKPLYIIFPDGAIKREK